MPENEIVLPVIPHADVSLNIYNRVVIRMDPGWVFWDRQDYIDENGDMYEPEPSEIGYSRYAVYSPTYDFSTFVVVAESDVPADQIYGMPNPPVGTE